MKKFTDSQISFVAIAILTALVCAFSISKRIQVENANQYVMFAAEVDTIQSYSAAQGMTLEQGIKELKTKGLNGLVVPEETIGELISDGRAELTGVTVASKDQVRSLLFADEETVKRVTRGMGIRFGELVKTVVPRDRRLALPPVDTGSLRSTAIGLDPLVTRLAKENGLGIIARCANPPGVTSKAVIATLEWAKEMGATIFLAQGEQVLGRRNAMDATVSTLQSTGLLYASPEFAKLGGDVEMLGKVGDQTVRLHSAQAAELDKLSLDSAIERFRKAARERNMRILLLRGISNASDAPITTFGEFIQTISYQLQAEGLKEGQPQPYQEPGVPKTVKMLIGLLSGIGAVWVGVRLLGDNRGLIVGGLGGLAIFLGSTREGTALQLAALMASLVFPCGAFFFMLESKLAPWIGLITSALLAMVSGMCVAGLLNGVEYYIRAETFPGVKISVFLPVLILGVIGFAKLNSLKDALKDPITWGAAVTGLVIMAIIGLMILRTGNDNPNTVSGGELAFRGLLEQLLPVRPRSKEFLLAFPALFVGLAMLHKAHYDSAQLGKMRGWVSLLLMLGVVGLTDVVNTMCHLHTPVMTSVIRNIEGIILGGIVGQIVWLVVQKFLVKQMEILNG
ncbi:MAG: DUF5693 family protein [Armatimonadota bacterium]